MFLFYFKKEYIRCASQNKPSSEDGVYEQIIQLLNLNLYDMINGREKFEVSYDKLENNLIPRHPMSMILFVLQRKCFDGCFKLISIRFDDVILGKDIK